MRLFVAINLPPTFAAAPETRPPSLPGVKWVPPENLHLTLRFLGSIPDEQVPSVKDALASVAFEPFTLTVSKHGFFPNERRPAVFWIGFEENGTLTELKQSIDKALAPFPAKEDSRPFVPHATLARIKRGNGNDILAAAAPRLPHPGTTLDIAEFILFSSETLPTGARHTPLASFPPST